MFRHTVRAQLCSTTWVGVDTDVACDTACHPSHHNSSCAAWFVQCVETVHGIVSFSHIQDVATAPLLHLRVFPSSLSPPSTLDKASAPTRACT
eukprot:7524755-Alexandrium_andersonii.AAC.1